MAYTFRLDEPIGVGAGRVGCEQIDQAIALLDEPADPHRAVHEARKCLKRTRALLRLAQPAIPEKTFRTENGRFRDIARSLSHARQSQAMLEALARLEEAAVQSGGRQRFERVCAWFESRRSAVEQDLDEGTLEAALAGLRKARRRFAGIHLEDAAERTFDGLADCYRRGRKTRRQAEKHGEDEAYHEWRKSVQHHWRHMQLLAPCWPAALEVRVATAKELSQTLGDDHDLYELIGQLRANQEELGSASAIEALIGVCAERQRALRRQARILGDRLYAEKPAAFRDRMRSYWQTARRYKPADTEPGLPTEDVQVGAEANTPVETSPSEAQETPRSADIVPFESPAGRKGESPRVEPAEATTIPDSPLSKPET